MKANYFREEIDAFARQRSFLDDFVLPDYEKFNVRNICSMIGGIFGVNSLISFKFPEEYLDDLTGVEKVFLLIIDGLGYNRLLTHIENSEGAFSGLSERGILKPLTSTFPATTSTSLASIFTGLSPSEHGLIGYHMFSREYGFVFNTLDMRPVYGYGSRVDIAGDFSKKMKPWMSKLREQDIGTMITTKGSLVGSGLSRVTYKDQDIMTYLLESDMLVRCRRTLEEPGSTLLTVYYGGVDSLEHRYGPYSEEVTSEMQSLESNLKDLITKLSKATKERTLILVTADHGVSETSKVYSIKDTPQITDRLMLPPVGDSRATFMFSKHGQNEALRSAFEKSIDGFKLLQSQELIEKEAFGRSRDSASLRATVGDFAALSTSRNALQYPYFDEDRTRSQLGSHGGMTAEEIIVPLLSLKLSKF